MGGAHASGMPAMWDGRRGKGGRKENLPFRLAGTARLAVMSRYETQGEALACLQEADGYSHSFCRFVTRGQRDGRIPLR